MSQRTSNVLSGMKAWNRNINGCYKSGHFKNNGELSRYHLSFPGDLCYVVWFSKTVCYTWWRILHSHWEISQSSRVMGVSLAPCPGDVSILSLSLSKQHWVQVSLKNNFPCDRNAQNLLRAVTTGIEGSESGFKRGCIQRCVLMHHLELLTIILLRLYHCEVSSIFLGFPEV